jgi:hypothetical protein
LVNKLAPEPQPYALSSTNFNDGLTLNCYQDQEIAEIKSRLKTLQRKLERQGYLDQGEDSPKLEDARAQDAREQAQRVQNIQQLRVMEQSLGKRVSRVTGDVEYPTTAEPRESLFTGMIEERGRRFLQ